MYSIREVNGRRKCGYKTCVNVGTCLGLLDV